MLRGQIFWCDLEPRRGHEQGELRPVAVVSVNPYNSSKSPLVGVIPFTRAQPKNPLHIALAPAETGLGFVSTALIDHVRFIDRSRVRPTPIGQIMPEAQSRIDKNLARLLGV
jgi:mRNA interferase MazF